MQYSDVIIYISISCSHHSHVITLSHSQILILSPHPLPLFLTLYRSLPHSLSVTHSFSHLIFLAPHFHSASFTLSQLLLFSYFLTLRCTWKWMYGHGECLPKMDPLTPMETGSPPWNPSAWTYIHLYVGSRTVLYASVFIRVHMFYASTFNAYACV